MEKLHLSIPLCAKVTPYDAPPVVYSLKSNDRFTVCKCYVQGLGKNQNMSYFSKDVVEKALPTLFYAPVIGHIRDDGEDGIYMGSHDVMVTIDDKGVDIKSVCIPYGVVPMQDTARFENVTNPDDGTQTEYLVCDVILWTGRFPELLEVAYSDSFYFNQSMEIEATNYRNLEEDPRYLEVLDFEYSALCLLGKADDKNSKEHTEPCFPMASVIPYEYNLKSESFTDMMGQLKYELASCFIQENSKEGGDKQGMPNEVNESVQDESSLNDPVVMTEEAEGDNPAEPVDAADEAEEPVDESVEEEAEAEEERADEEDAEDEEVPPTEVKMSMAATYRQRYEMLSALFNDEVIYDDAGNIISETYYYVCDFSEEYVFVEIDRYDANGYSSVHGRYPVSFSEDGSSVSIVGSFEEMYLKWLTAEELANIESMNREFGELKEFKRSTLEKELHCAMDEVISEFDDIRETEEFAYIRENPYRFGSVDELRTACFAARGKVTRPKTKQTFSARVPLTNEESAEGGTSRYGDLFDRFARR